MLSGKSTTQFSKPLYDCIVLILLVACPAIEFHFEQVALIASSYSFLCRRRKRTPKAALYFGICLSFSGLDEGYAVGQSLRCPKQHPCVFC